MNSFLKEKEKETSKSQIKDGYLRLVLFSITILSSSSKISESYSTSDPSETVPLVSIPEAVIVSMSLDMLTTVYIVL